MFFCSTDPHTMSQRPVPQPASSHGRSRTHLEIRWHVRVLHGVLEPVGHHVQRALEVLAHGAVHGQLHAALGVGRDVLEPLARGHDHGARGLYDAVPGRRGRVLGCALRRQQHFLLGEDLGEHALVLLREPLHVAQHDRPLGLARSKRQLIGSCGAPGSHGGVPVAQVAPELADLQPLLRRERWQLLHGREEVVGAHDALGGLLLLVGTLLTLLQPREHGHTGRHGGRPVQHAHAQPHHVKASFSDMT